MGKILVGNLYKIRILPIHLHQMVVSMLVRAQAVPKNMLFAMTEAFIIQIRHIPLLLEVV